MTCREFAEFLHAYLAGEMPEEQRQAFRRHLQLCIDCEHYIGTYQHTVHACRLLGSEHSTVPPEVPEELVSAILAARNDQA